MEHCFSFSLVWERCVASYMTWNPRIGEYLAFAVATAGKWLFMLLNPFVQVGLALMMFYLASGRRVDPRSWPDVRLFGLGLLLLFTLHGPARRHDLLALRSHQLFLGRRRLAGLSVSVPRFAGRRGIREKGRFRKKQ